MSRVPAGRTLLAGAGFDTPVLPIGLRRIGVAGAVQGTPIRLVKARTVDAMAIADSELVLEATSTPRDPPLRDEGVRRRRHPGPVSLPSEWGGLHGQGL